MKKFLALLAVSFMLSSCGSSSSSSDGTNTDALEYAKFGETVDNAIPTGLKAGVASANIAKGFLKELSSACVSVYTDCPYLTETGGGDSTTGEILLRLWGLDYDHECTSAYLADGTCITCADCETGGYGNNYIKPTMLATPSQCATISTTSGRYVNFDMDPCFFDTIVGQITNIPTCKTTVGGSVDISTAVPWYASWGLPPTINFSSYNAQDDGGHLWWTINNGNSGSDQYFLRLDSDWVNVGIKKTSSDQFLFFGSGSPAHYASLGQGSGVNISGYAGTLSTVPAQFEAIQVRVQDPHKYIERMKSNGEYLWYQKWSSDDFPETLADVDTYKDSPIINRCVQIGSSIVLSKYVPLATCVAEFGKTTTDELNQDDNYTLKIIDGTTASAISFTTSLTPTVSSTACLPETPVQ